jgi:UDP-N-acetylglucosamine 2-epimerase (non-hydrolysing)
MARKILTILGTRPEAIKLAPVIRELGKWPDEFVSRVCATAQHRELLDQALVPLEITPDIDLALMAPGQTLGGLTARAIFELDAVMTRERPDAVLVQGDTTTAFCGALAAFYHQVPVGHVEAGLRTGNKYAPFPEEANRCFISQIADFHFAPTERARRALLESGIDERNVYLTGNTVIDALRWMRERVKGKTPPGVAAVARAIERRDLVLVTGHRRESFGEGFEQICRAIRDLADRFPASVFVYPVHLNPNVREPVLRILGNHPRIRLVEPLPYDAFIWLLDRAVVVLTDSGGVQEEAPVFGKPVLVMREVTERKEGIEAGSAALVGVGREEIVAATAALLESAEKRAVMGRASNPYGDGHAAERIAQVLLARLPTTP